MNEREGRREQSFYEVAEAAAFLARDLHGGRRVTQYVDDDQDSDAVWRIEVRKDRKSRLQHLADTLIDKRALTPEEEEWARQFGQQLRYPTPDRSSVRALVSAVRQFLASNPVFSGSPDNVRAWAGTLGAVRNAVEIFPTEPPS